MDRHRAGTAVIPPPPLAPKHLHASQSRSVRDALKPPTHGEKRKQISSNTTMMDTQRFRSIPTTSVYICMHQYLYAVQSGDAKPAARGGRPVRPCDGKCRVSKILSNINCSYVLNIIPGEGCAHDTSSYSIVLLTLVSMWLHTHLLA